MAVDEDLSEKHEIQTDRRQKKQAAIGHLDERYLSLVWNVLAADSHAGEGSSRAVGVTSSLPGEGTSTVALNIAVTAAGLNAGPVLLVDANTQRPSVHKAFGIDGDIGLQNALSGELDPLECIAPSSVDNLSLIPIGRIEPGGVAIYSKSSLDELLIDMKDLFRWIVFDLPPASESTVCTSLASRLDGVLVVVEADRVDRDLGRRTCDRLRRARANLLGAVYNKVPRGRGSSAR
jgi:capsular exopolysaccharide synthesis family protein